MYVYDDVILNMVDVPSEGGGVVLTAPLIVGDVLAFVYSNVIFLRLQSLRYSRNARGELMHQQLGTQRWKCKR